MQTLIVRYNKFHFTQSSLNPLVGVYWTERERENERERMKWKQGYNLQDCIDGAGNIDEILQEPTDLWDIVSI
jgi:hypothetical protein